MKKILKITKRYLRVYKMILQLNVIRLFSYRAHLISTIISNTSWATFSMFSMVLLVGRASGVYGWTGDELLILAGTYNIIFSIFYFLFSPNFSEFSNTVHYGRLDGVLTKPIDSQFLVSCTYVSYTQSIRFLLGLIFVIVILIKAHFAITLLSVLSFILFVFVSIIILYSLWMGVMTFLIWHSKLSNLTDLLYEGHNVSKYPQEIYRGASEIIFFALFPLTLVVVIPAKALIQKLVFTDIIWPFFFATLMFYISRRFWKFALRSYTSASG